MRSARSLLSTSEGSVDSRGFFLVWLRTLFGKRAGNNLILKTGSVSRMAASAEERPEDPAAPGVTHLSPKATVLPTSVDAECCGQIRFPKELGVLAVLWCWDSLHTLATGLAVEVSGTQALLNVCSALEALNTGHVYSTVPSPRFL